MTQKIFVLVEHLRGQVLEISYVLLAAAQSLAASLDAEVVALLLGHNDQALANTLAADKVHYIDHAALEDFTADAYLKVLADQIQQHQPRGVLFGHTSIGMDVASGLSVRNNLPLITQCQNIIAAPESLQFVSQICAGKIMAESQNREPVVLVTVVPGFFKPERGKTGQVPPIIHQAVPPFVDLRVKLTRYVEPEADEVDITKASMLVAVGRGLQNGDDMELFEDLAEALGGVVCASRPIIDQGWLPASRLVGKSGRTVKPKLYLVMGVSGAPEHVEGMTGSELVIAVNTDPNAPIFDIAQFGAVVDMFDLQESMIDQIEGVKVA